MKQVYVITLDIEAYTDRPDLLEAIMANVATEGLEQYHQLGELEPFDTLRVLQSPPQAIDEQQLRQRRQDQDRLRLSHKIVEKRLGYTADPPSKQLAMPGL